MVEDYHKQYEGDILAESWELSCHPDGPSFIVNGIYEGKTLKEFLDMEGNKVLGTNCQRFDDFPILIKFIDAKDNPSIQVHPMVFPRESPKRNMKSVLQMIPCWRF